MIVTAGANQHQTCGNGLANGFPLTDTGNAERFVDRHGHVVRYCYPWKKWLAWDGRRWRIDDHGTIDHFAKLTARSILSEAADEPDKKQRDALVSFAKASESALRRNAMVKLAQSELGIPILPDALDKNPWLLNCVNGTLNLRSGELLAHNRADMLTKLCPTAFDPAATCPLWRAFLDRIFAGNFELIEFVQRVCGMCLTGDVSEQILLVYHGVGANGKSVLLNTQAAMMGLDYGMQAPPDLLMERRGDTHPTERADLHGKRLVCSIETEDGRRLAESLVKSLTGGDPLRARRMHEDFWQFLPTHKLILACNHKPVIRGTDHGIWRRIRLVPFNVVIPPEDQDKNLAARLQAELPGILAWSVQGCLAWQQHGLGEPEEVIAATSNYRTEQDALAEFLGECCVLDADSYDRASALFSAYSSWSGDKSVTQRRFGRAMTERGFERFQSHGICYRGVRLNHSNGDTDDTA